MEGAVLTAFVGATLRKLGAMLQEKYSTFGVSRDIAILRDDLQTMQASLKLSEDDPLVSDFLIKIREVSYDVEDITDVYMLRMERQQGFRTLVEKAKDFVGTLKTRHQTAKQIEDLKRRSKKISDRLGSIAASSSSRYSVPLADCPPPELHGDATTTILVGVDGPRDEVAKLLLMGEEPESVARLAVLSILGTAGIGKTTLAQLIFRVTEPYFGCRAWVSVSRKPKWKNILMGILRQVEDPHRGDGGSSSDSERDLIRKIKQSLQRKRYLLVFDDVWSTETWEIIKSALPSNRYGSRVIITTRSDNVAKTCCDHWNDHIYNMKPLSEKDSRMLFHRRIFVSVGSCPQDLVDVSNRILKKCSGVPLAITIVSSLLANKPCTRSIWEDVCTSIGANPQGIEGMKIISLLGYNHLPYHLKACLLYLSIFPEDYIINRDCMIRRWIAEGFILETHGTTSEEVGDIYLNELISRNMIQPVLVNYDGETDTCVVHDLVRDIARSKAIEENLVFILDNEKTVSALHSKIRRLSIINVNEDHCIPASATMSHLRSLSIFGSVEPKFSFKHMTILRILDLQGCKNLNNCSIEGIADLTYLTYLGMRGTTMITQLPDGICQLVNLKTLDIGHTNIKEFPKGFWRLQRLKYLHCDNIRLPEKIGKMVELSSLSQFDIFQSKMLAVEELGNLSKLRKLVLWWLPDLESNNTKRYKNFAISLYRLHSLQSLGIHGSDSSVDILDHLYHPLQQLHRVQLNSSCYLNRIPEWFRSLPSLAYLSIDIKEVKNEDIQLLSALPSLIHLSLSSKAMPTEKLVISSNGFSLLRDFHLFSARADLTFEAEAMQKIEKLLLSLHILPGETYSFSINISQFMCLKKIDISINGKGAAVSQLFADLDVAIRKAADEHPNHPIVNMVVLGNLVDYASLEGKENEQKLKPVIQISQSVPRPCHGACTLS
ncbi:unnamed protein product [Urochloa humidicola]